jgi:CspA family cold shock protein
VDYFAYYTEIKSAGFKTLAKGQHVKFIGKEGPKGLYAEEISVISE